jgi:hypothetical protein
VSLGCVCLTSAEAICAQHQGTNTYPKAAGFASLLVPSIIDAKFQARPRAMAKLKQVRALKSSGVKHEVENAGEGQRRML